MYIYRAGRSKFAVILLCLVARGDVVTMDCVDRLIRKSGMACPISGKILKESDIIRIARVSVQQYTSPWVNKHTAVDPCNNIHLLHPLLLNTKIYYT